ncbi:hypothetical protein OIDMADRAFT_56598 [Oidiodendron maius Zn]|uniref:Uncharacterized protein n=1 Tax=Oidiodendron maius (strain Zn) TaxID=913774 RepID=A0A0C3D8I3_OIDMZ|nr:hypothetical protein OIDMADRAFT_56598 [Oidiodendron maius Zn]
MSSTSSLLETSQTQPSTPTGAPAATSAPHVVSQGLSNGAIPAITVSVTIVGILIIRALGFLVWRHIRKNTDQRDQRDVIAELPDAKIDLDKIDTGILAGVQKIPAQNGIKK